MNIFQYASSEEKMFENIVANNGYTRKTTFYSDLSIAEAYGLKAIKDTYKNVVESWKDDVIYFTEFVLCLNYKSWEWHSRGNDKIGQLYADLYYKAHRLAQKTFKGDDARYYFETTD